MSCAERRVLVTDGDQRAALAVVRSLGASGYRCVVCSTTGRSLAGSSRYAERDVCVPEAAGDGKAFATAIEQLVRAQRIDIVIPVSEAALLAVLPERARIDALIPFPALSTFNAICDKARVLAAAAEIGIRVPRQRIIETIEAGHGLEASDLPVVLKPHASVVAAENGSRRKVGVSWAHTERQLDRALRSYPPGAFPLLAQEVIPGPGIGIFVLIHDGHLVASFAHRRIREKPPSGGVSVLCQSEPMDATLLELTQQLLKRFEWSGVAMVEYKRDERTGEAVLMEINGRFWGSLQLAIDARVDFPQMLAAISFGDPVANSNGYQLVRDRWFWGDVDHLLARWREPGAAWRARLGAFVGWLRAFGPGYRSEVFRWRDPHPFFRETASWLGRLNSR